MSHSRHNSTDADMSATLSPDDDLAEYRHILETFIRQPVDVVLQYLVTEEHTPLQQRISPTQCEISNIHTAFLHMPCTPLERERDALTRYNRLVSSMIPANTPVKDREYFQKRAERIACKELLKNGPQPPALSSRAKHLHSMALFTHSAPSTPTTTSSATSTPTKNNDNDNDDDDDVFESSDTRRKQVIN